MTFSWVAFVRNAVTRVQQVAPLRKRGKLRDRQGYFLSTLPLVICCERLEERRLLSATVVSDKHDYAPGSTATFTAANDATTTSANFQPGEAIEFQVTRTDGVPATGDSTLPWD